MTKNQVEYAKLLETRRSNLANEARDHKRLQQDRSIAMAQLRETNRSNLERERVNVLSLDETRRSNLAREFETNRSAVAREKLTRSELDESVRSHLASEAQRRSELTETERTNRERERQAESQRETNARLKIADQEIARGSQQLGWSQLMESIRHNTKSEALSRVANEIKRLDIDERARHNLEDELIAWYNAETSRYKSPLATGLGIASSALDGIKDFNSSIEKGEIPQSMQNALDRLGLEWDNGHIVKQRRKGEFDESGFQKPGLQGTFRKTQP